MYDEILSMLGTIINDNQMPDSARNAASFYAHNIEHGFINHLAIADIVFRFKPESIGDMLRTDNAVQLIEGIAESAANNFFEGKCDLCIYSRNCKMRCYRVWKRCTVCLSDCMEQCKIGMKKYLTTKFVLSELQQENQPFELS